MIQNSGCRLGKLSRRLISWVIRLIRLHNNGELLSKPKLERNSSLREWQWVYLEQEAALLSEKYKNTKETKNKVKNTGKILKI